MPITTLSPYRKGMLPPNPESHQRYYDTELNRIQRSIQSVQTGLGTNVPQHPLGSSDILTSSTTGVAMTSGVAAAVTSVNLGAGTWVISGGVRGNPAATTVITSLNATTNLSSGVINADVFNGHLSLSAQQPAGGAITAPLGTYILTLASASTLYLNVNIGFTTSTLTCDGVIYAVRIA